MDFEYFLKLSFEEKIRLYNNKNLVNKYFNNNENIEDWFNFNIIEKYKSISNKIMLDVNIKKLLNLKSNIINDSKLNYYSLNITYYDIEQNKILEETNQLDEEGIKEFKIKFFNNFN